MSGEAGLYPWVEHQTVWGNALKFKVASVRSADWYSGEGYIRRAAGDFELARQRMDNWNPPLREMIKPGMMVIDAGCNEGWTTCVFAKAVGPTGRVIAIDADPDNCALVRENIALNGLHNVVVVNRCISDKSGEAKLFHAECVQAKEGRLVETLALDDLESIGVSGLADVCKIDVEGFELPLLRGAQKLLAHGAALEVEMHLDAGGGVNMFEYYGFDPLEITATLRRFGYTLRIDGREMGIGELPMSGGIWCTRSEKMIHAKVER